MVYLSLKHAPVENKESSSDYCTLVVQGEPSCWFYDAASTHHKNKMAANNALSRYKAISATYISIQTCEVKNPTVL